MTEHRLEVKYDTVLTVNGKRHWALGKPPQGRTRPLWVEVCRDTPGLPCLRDSTPLIPAVWGRRQTEGAFGRRALDLSTFLLHRTGGPCRRRYTSWRIPWAATWFWLRWTTWSPGPPRPPRRPRLLWRRSPSAARWTAERSAGPTSGPRHMCYAGGGTSD